MIRTLFLLLTLSAANTCDHAALPNVYLATSQSWSGGAAGSGHGTRFLIYLNANECKGIAFDSLWVNMKRLPANVLTSRNDTLIVEAENFVRGILPEGYPNDQPETAPVEFPVSSSGSGLLGGMVKRDRIYVSIPYWKILPHLAYP